MWMAAKTVGFSASNCTEYQARRLNIRERMEDGGTRAVSTLNGTLATPLLCI